MQDKAQTLYDLISDVIDSDEYPIVMVLGVLDLIKAELTSQALDTNED